VLPALILVPINPSGHNDTLHKMNEKEAEREFTEDTSYKRSKSFKVIVPLYRLNSYGN